MSVVSISMPEALLERIDEFAGEHGYSGRSEVIREGTRTLFEEFQEENINRGKRMCTVTAVFEYREPTTQQRLTGVRHEFDAIVSATTHTHVEEQYCMELFVIEGTAEVLSEFVNTVRAVPGIRAVEYSVTSLGDDPTDRHVES